MNSKTLVHLSENQVIVWKSPDGKLFEDEAKYKKHMTAYAAEQAWEDTRSKIHELKKIFNEELRECTNFDEISEVIVKRWGDLLFSLPYIKSQKTPKWYYSGIDICSINYRPWRRETFNIPNTHKCPEGGVRNWQEDPNLPTSYPGILARMSLELRAVSAFSSEMFDNTLIKTGTGGGGGASYAYDIYIFRDDFPNLKIWEKISEDDCSNFEDLL